MYALHRSLFLGLALSAAGFHTPVASANSAGKSVPVPDGAAVSLQTKRLTYFLGEDVVASFGLKNNGATPFQIDVGGDYRSTGRHNRFLVEARDANGIVADDPLANAPDFGGLGYSPVIAPGGDWNDTLSLPHFCDFETSGLYTVTVMHDLGWTSSQQHPLPSAQTHFEMRMPSPEQARGVMGALEARSKALALHPGLPDSELAPDYSILHYPVYLPLLLERIDAGKPEYLESVYTLNTPEATRALLDRLKGSAESKQRIADHLVRRMPPLPVPEYAKNSPLALAMFVQQQKIAAATWRDEFALPLRAYAREALINNTSVARTTAPRILQRIGTMDDVPTIRAALDRCLTPVAPSPDDQSATIKPVLFDPNSQNQGLLMPQDGQVLMETYRDIVDRSGTWPSDTISPEHESLSDICFHLALTSTDGKQNWTPDYARWLQNPNAFIRRIALQSLSAPYASNLTVPLQLAPQERELLPALLRDSDSGVRNAAFFLAGESRDKTLLPNVLSAMTTTATAASGSQASIAAAKLGGQYEAWTIWASRLDQPQIMRTAIAELSKVVGLRYGYGWTGPFEPSEGVQLKPRWQKFLADNKERLQNGKLFSRTDVDWPKDLFPKAFNVSG